MKAASADPSSVGMKNVTASDAQPLFQLAGELFPDVRAELVPFLERILDKLEFIDRQAAPVCAAVRRAP